jgi:hypothetical protein
MEKIDDAIDDGKLPWDEDDGVNFHMSAKKKGKMSNYDASYFDSVQIPLSKYGDVDDILNRVHDLKEFLDPSSYKSYDELKQKYAKVIGEKDTSPAPSPAPHKKRKVVQEDIENDIYDNDDSGDVNNVSFDDDDDDDFFDDLD